MKPSLWIKSDLRSHQPRLFDLHKVCLVVQQKSTPLCGLNEEKNWNRKCGNKSLFPFCMIMTLAEFHRCCL